MHRESTLGVYGDAFYVSLKGPEMMLYFHCDKVSVLNIYIYTSYNDSLFVELYTAIIIKNFVERYGTDLNDFIFLGALVSARTGAKS